VAAHRIAGEANVLNDHFRVAAVLQN